MANAYTTLVDDLKSHKLTLSMIETAIMEWINSRKDLPDGVKNLLAQPGGGGLLSGSFRQIGEIIGTVELAYRRGQQDHV